VAVAARSHPAFRGHSGPHVLSSETTAKAGVNRHLAGGVSKYREDAQKFFFSINTLSRY
jgi:hypothetical protein